MKRPPKERPRQMVSEEVLGSLLELIRTKFYQGQGVAFVKDRPRLLRWVIFWPAAKWFAEKAITIPPGRYREILSGVILQAATHQAEEIRYIPAWLGQVVQSHFAHHGEEIYEEAKSLRSLADHALATLGRLPVKASDDVVAKFTAADRLLATTKQASVRVKKEAGRGQLNLI